MIPLNENDWWLSFYFFFNTPQHPEDPFTTHACVPLLQNITDSPSYSISYASYSSFMNDVLELPTGTPSDQLTTILFAFGRFRPKLQKPRITFKSS